MYRETFELPSVITPETSSTSKRKKTKKKLTQEQAEREEYVQAYLAQKSHKMHVTQKESEYIVAKFLKLKPPKLKDESKDPSEKEVEEIKEGAKGNKTKTKSEPVSKSIKLISKQPPSISFHGRKRRK